MRICQFRSMFLLNRVESGDQIVSVWTRNEKGSPAISLRGMLPVATTYT